MGQTEPSPPNNGQRRKDEEYVSLLAWILGPLLFGSIVGGIAFWVEKDLSEAIVGAVGGCA